MKNRAAQSTVVVLLLIFMLGMIPGSTYVRSYLVFAESLDKKAVIVDDNPLTLRDLAYYIAYEERQMEETARIYNDADTGEFWRIHTNGAFVRTEAKQTVIDMAVCDEIFYRIACENQLTLTPEEQSYLWNEQYDFWSDLDEDQRKSLGISEEELARSMEKAALAQKAQAFLAEQNFTELREYQFTGDAYQELLQEHKVRVVEKIWERVDFGAVTVDH